MLKVPIEKIGIGTAHFGMEYGTFNNRGRPSNNRVAEVIEYAANMGISALDTAAAYGESERILGETMPMNHSFRIVTKTPMLNTCGDGNTAKQALLRAFDQSLKALRGPRVYGLLVHHCEDLLGPNGEIIFNAMQELKQQGKVERIGASIYTRQQIERLMERYPLDLVQLPLNVFDHRLIESGTLRHLKQAGVEIHARSVFLQGLLLTDPLTLPVFFAPVREALLRFQIYASLHNLLPAQAAIQFVLAQEAVDVALVGVTSVSKLKQVMSSVWLQEIDWTAFRVPCDEILNPVLWPKQVGGTR